jgi:DNA modification methylase
MTKPLSNLLGRIHHGDCVAGLRNVPDGSIDLVFADPPFNIGYAYDEYDDRLDEQKYIDWCAQWMSEVFRVIKDDGTFWLAIGDEYAAELKVAAKKIGFKMRNWVIWYYTFGVHCSSKFTRSHAHLFYFTKNEKSVRFNFPEVAVPSARQLVYNDKRGNPAGRSPDDTWILRPQDCTDGFQPDEDTWYFPRVAGTFKERAGFHGCQMPEQLLGRIIRACTSKGDVVVDPFSGSATTLTVAKKLEREFFGFELSKDYHERGSTRLEQVDAGDALEGAAEPLASAPKTIERLKGAKLVEPTKIESELNAEAQGIIESFAKSNRGFSVDRLVADPILNSDFQDHCNQLSVPGSPAERNRFLFRLRKSGRLARAGVFANKPTEFNWLQMDSFLHASEIAWRLIGESYSASLDEILCDPRLAAEFDRQAAKLAPDFTPLEFRWGALKLRKQAAKAKNTLPDVTQLLKQTATPLNEFDKSRWADSEGVYAIQQAGSKSSLVFVGETQSLRQGLASILDAGVLDHWYTLGQSQNLQLVQLPISIRTRMSSQIAVLRSTNGSRLNTDHFDRAA